MQSCKQPGRLHLTEIEKSVCFTAAKHFLGSKQILLLGDNSKISSRRTQSKLFHRTMNLHKNFDKEQSYLGQNFSFTTDLSAITKPSNYWLFEMCVGLFFCFLLLFGFFGV